MQLLQILSVSLHLSLIHCFAQQPTNSISPSPSTTSCPASEDMVSDKLRSVQKVMPRPPAHWVGDGFHVYPVFANLAFKKEMSPLLMFDYAYPKQFPAKVGPPVGVGQHPHRGFETVTIAFQGEVEHKDSAGNSGVIGPGDVQWMTAGRGVIHQEYHSEKFTRTGGTFEMCQLWVNLPKKHKMTKPRYQSILNNDIPVVNLPLNSENPLATARLIAGEMADTKGAAKTFSPVQFWDINIPKAGSEVDIPFPAEHTCIVFVRRGSVQIVSGKEESSLKDTKLGPQDVALMRTDGADTLRVRVGEGNTSILILGGEPIDEPIAAHGPFVMNTNDEINQAISDYRMGKMGR